MNYSIKSLALLAVVFPTFVFAQGQHRDDRHYFSWVLPADWQHIDYIIPPIVVNYAKKGTRNEVSCNLAVHSDKVAKSQGTKKYIAGYKERDLKHMLNSIGTNVSVMSKDYFKIAGRDAVSFVSEYRLQHHDMTDRIRQINIFTTRHDLVYTITCAMPQNDYKRHEGDVWRFIKGFYVYP